MPQKSSTAVVRPEKIQLNCKKRVWLKRRYFSCKFLSFDTFFRMVVFKVFSPCKTISKFDIKSLIMPQLTSVWCFYYDTWTRFYLLYVLEESEVVARKSSLKKVFLKNSQNSQENICAEVSFAIKLKAGGLQLH